METRSHSKIDHSSSPVFVGPPVGRMRDVFAVLALSLSLGCPAKGVPAKPSESSSTVSSRSTDQSNLPEKLPPAIAPLSTSVRESLTRSLALIEARERSEAERELGNELMELLGISSGIESPSRLKYLKILFSEVGNTNRDAARARAVVRLFDAVIGERTRRVPAKLHESPADFFRESGKKMVELLLSPEMEPHDAIPLGRLMDQQGIAQVDTRHVQEAQQRLEEIRRDFHAHEIFSARKPVIFFANNELIRGKEHRFGLERDLSAIRSFTPLSVEFSRAPAPGASREDFSRFLEKVQHDIVQAPLGHTFVFDGHGEKQAFLFQSSHNEPSTSLSVEQFTTMLIERSRRLENEGAQGQRDTVVISACYTSDFVVAVATGLRNQKHCPVFVVSAERGFFSISNEPDDSHGNPFFKNLIVGDERMPARVTVGGYHHRRKLRSTWEGKSTVFVPTESGYVQIQ